MSKILKNTTISNISILDTGVTILASPGTYTIPPQDYLLWAASSDVISYIGSGDIVVNDGSFDLTASDGTDLIKGLFPKQIKITGDSDNTKIGNVNDKLKVIDEDANNSLNVIISALGGAVDGIIRKNEVYITSRNETDMPSTTYTVPSGKKFIINSFSAAYDAQASMQVRLKKQTSGTGPFETLFRLNVMSGGQGNSTLSYGLGNGITIGNAGDVFKITYEASIAKGNLFSAFTGNEV